MGAVLIDNEDMVAGDIVASGMRSGGNNWRRLIVGT